LVASGVAVEEWSWFNDTADAAALADRSPITSRAAGRFNLQATISISDEGLCDSYLRAGVLQSVSIAFWSPHWEACLCTMILRHAAAVVRAAVLALVIS
jgi:hypothetical protein